MKMTRWALVLIVSCIGPAGGQTQHRGFTVWQMDTPILEAVAKDWNANMVRYTIRPSYVAHDVERCPVQETWKRMLAALPGQLDTAKRLGVLVVLDLHDAPDYLIPTYPHGHKDVKEFHRWFWADPGPLELRKKYWRDLATVCKDRPEEIWFDLMNEPLNWNDFPGYAKNWPRWAQAMIDEIRKIDRRHTIVVEVGPGGLGWGFKDFPALKDPCRPLIYSVHMYQPQEYTHQGISDIQGTDLAKAYLKRQRGWPGTFGDSGGGLWDKKRLETELAPVREFQKRHGIRIYVGEFGVARWAPDAPAYLQALLEIFERYGWDWTYHSLGECHIWSLEHVNDYEKNEISKTPTDRARMVKMYLDRNRRKHEPKQAR